MPIYLGPLTRRELIQRALTGAGALAIPLSASAGVQPDADRLVLFSDTHICQNASEVCRDVNMSGHFAQAVTEALAAPGRPGAVLVNGDCAYLTGQAGDYSQFVSLLKPVREAGVPLHFVLGNHDHRTNFRDGVLHATGRPVLADKHVGIVRTARASLFLLDSLDKTNVTPGLLGSDQLTWLGRALDHNADRPAIVFVHHQPNFEEFGTVGGITDTDALFRTLAPRTQVKALFFGHTHHWLVKEREGIHCVNLPPVAYVFDPKDPSGWVDLHMREYGAILKFHTVGPAHKANGEEHRLVWR